MSYRRLVLLFDGTWDRPERSTNVWRARVMLHQSESQLIYYDPGVGTERHEHIRGGAVGTGLSRKVLAGYLWLLQNYRPSTEETGVSGDDICLIGFSRGAYTARSLVGLLGLCGLLKINAPISILHAFHLSRIEGVTRAAGAFKRFRKRYSMDVRVRFLGLWDTVSALGINKMFVPGAERLSLHKTESFEIVDHARHALALDEHRKVFRPTFFPQKTSSNVSMEERWFTGSHANVGGGYLRDGLCLRPLQWMLTEAEKAGLSVRSSMLDLDDAFYSSSPRDSLGEVWHGLYNFTQWFKTYTRDICLSGTRPQTLDYTVLERWLWDRTYNPLLLEMHLSPFAKNRATKPKYQLSDQDILQRLPCLQTHVEDRTHRGFTFRNPA
jgi:uncharacterized protein (DUF2235 family)